MQKSLLKKANALAHELDISRSRLFTLAVEEYIKRYQNRKLLNEINEAYDDELLSPEEEELNYRIRQQHRRITAGEWIS